MNENAESLPPKQVVFQVVATRAGDQNGPNFRARLGPKPFLIGSGKTASMLLDNPQILPVHIRLLSSTTGQVLLTNLGDDNSVLMNDEPVPTLVPVYWKPGLTIRLADFELELVTLVDVEGDGNLERVRPALITQANEIAPESQPEGGFVIEWGDSRDVRGEVAGKLPDNNTILFNQDMKVAEPDAVEPIENDDELDTREGWRLEATPKEALPQIPPPPPELPVLPDTPPDPLPRVPRLDDSESLPTEAMPLLEQFAQNAASPYTAVPTGNDTLPKNWHTAGKLSAQLTADSVNMVAGERVRIPVSVRNTSANPMQLRVHIAGLPRDWDAGFDSISLLEPGEIRSLDVIVESRIPFDQAYLDTLLRIHDQFSPDNYLTLPLRLNFKSSPNIVARLSPSRLAASQTTYLNLHNHTQVTINTFISGHSESPDLHVIPAQAQIELPPGQNIEIPVSVQPLSRPWFRGGDVRFAVSVRHGSRAALDYPGVARVRPRISLSTLLMLAVLIVALLVVWRLFGGGGGDLPASIVDSTPIVTASPLPAGIEETASPAETSESTTEIRAVVSPEVTVTLRPRATSTLKPTASPVPTKTAIPPTIAMTEILPTPLSLSSVSVDFVDPRPAGCDVEIPAGWKPYTVQSGDRAFRLAVTYNTTVEEIARINCLADARLLQLGQVLLLPVP